MHPDARKLYFVENKNYGLRCSLYIHITLSGPKKHNLGLQKYAIHSSCRFNKIILKYSKNLTDPSNKRFI